MRKNYGNEWIFSRQAIDVESIDVGQVASLRRFSTANSDFRCSKWHTIMIRVPKIAASADCFG
jgi:hypothetical protein